jgi:hypothetical protein
VLLKDYTLFGAATTDWGEERKTDVLLYYTQLIDAVGTIDLPEGYSATVIPESQVIDETYAYFKGVGKATGNQLVVETRAEVRRRQIPPEGYEGFYSAMQEAKKWTDALFRVEPEGRKQ